MKILDCAAVCSLSFAGLGLAAPNLNFNKRALQAMHGVVERDPGMMPYGGPPPGYGSQGSATAPGAGEGASTTCPSGAHGGGNTETIPSPSLPIIPPVSLSTIIVPPITTVPIVTPSTTIYVSIPVTSVVLPPPVTTSEGNGKPGHGHGKPPYSKETAVTSLPLSPPVVIPPGSGVPPCVGYGCPGATTTPIVIVPIPTASVPIVPVPGKSTPVVVVPAPGKSTPIVVVPVPGESTPAVIVPLPGKSTPVVVVPGESTPVVVVPVPGPTAPIETYPLLPPAETKPPKSKETGAGVPPEGELPSTYGPEVTNPILPPVVTSVAKVTKTYPVQTVPAGGYGTNTNSPILPTVPVEMSNNAGKEQYSKMLASMMMVLALGMGINVVV